MNCVYDGSRKRLKDGRCSVCGHTREGAAARALYEAAQHHYALLIDAEETHHQETGKEYDDIKALRIALRDCEKVGI